jgi:hypothetical protein
MTPHFAVPANAIEQVAEDNQSSPQQSQVPPEQPVPARRPHPVRRTARPRLDDPYARRIEYHRKRERRLFAKICRAIAAGQMLAAFRYRDTYLSCYSARFIAVVDENGTRPGHRIASETEVMVIAENLDVWRRCNEPVALDRRRKKSGAYRDITSFGLINRARLRLVERVMKPFLRLHPHQYAVQGGGKDAAVAAIYDALKDRTSPRSFKWVVRVDVSDFYGSIKLRDVEHWLPLHRKVIENTLTLGAFNLREAKRKPGAIAVPPLVPEFGSLLRGRVGIPQGSPCSNLVAEIVLAPLIDHMHQLGAWIRSYADDIIILAHTKREAEAHCKALIEALARHPAGPFDPKYAQVRRVSDGFEFLGQIFRTRYDRVKVKPVDHKVECFVGKIMTFLDLARCVPDKVDLKWLRLRVLAWIAQYPLWEEGKGIAELLLIGITNLEIDALISKSPIKPTVRPVPNVRLPERSVISAREPSAAYRGPELVLHDGPRVRFSRPTQ